MRAAVVCIDVGEDPDACRLERIGLDSIPCYGPIPGAADRIASR